MAQDTLGRMMKAGMLEKRPCHTQDLSVYGAANHHQTHERFDTYGTYARDISDLMNSNTGFDKLLHPRLPYTMAEIIWVCRHEMPGKIEDVLARRTRALILDAAASRTIAPEVAAVMAAELGFSKTWEKEQVEEFGELVKNYLCT
jgi:glycerol-3-phosphate dehydrogenase